MIKGCILERQGPPRKREREREREFSTRKKQVFEKSSCWKPRRACVKAVSSCTCTRNRKLRANINNASKKKREETKWRKREKKRKKKGKKKENEKFLRSGKREKVGLEKILSRLLFPAVCSVFSLYSKFVLHVLEREREREVFFFLLL